MKMATTGRRKSRAGAKGSRSRSPVGRRGSSRARRKSVSTGRVVRRSSQSPSTRLEAASEKSHARGRAIQRRQRPQNEQHGDSSQAGGQSFGEAAVQAKATGETGDAGQLQQQQQQPDAVRGAESGGKWDLTVMGGILGTAGTLYVLWVFASVVAWVSHLGSRVPSLGPLFAARAAPDNSRSPQSWQELGEAWMVLLPAGLIFVVTHSCMRPHQLQRWFGHSRYSRLIYNVIAALTLHYFLVVYRPLDTRVVVTMPIPERVHAYLSVISLVLAMWALLSDVRTYYFLGTTQALGIPTPAAQKTAPGMDIITWQTYVVYQRFGGIGFAAYSGLSIVPRDITVTDVIVRVVAAMYLRLRSRSFRQWLGKIQAIHLSTWAVRGVLGLVVVYNTESWGPRFAIVGAAAVATILMRVTE